MPTILFSESKFQAFPSRRLLLKIDGRQAQIVLIVFARIASNKDKIDRISSPSHKIFKSGNWILNVTVRRSSRPKETEDNINIKVSA